LGELKVTYPLHLYLVGKRVVDFLFAITEYLSLALKVETLKADIGQNRRFSKEVGQFNLISGRRGHLPLTSVSIRKRE